MKTETQITQNNIGNYLSSKKDNLVYVYCKEHKASCQRFLEFLEGFEYDGESKSRLSYLLGKMVDLKQAIKLYDEVEI